MNINTYLQDFFEDFKANYNAIHKDTIDTINSLGGSFQNFNHNKWWPESLLHYPQNRNTDFTEPSPNDNDTFQAIRLYSKIDKKERNFFRVISNNPVLNYLYPQNNDYLRESSLVDYRINTSITNFAKKYFDNLSVVLYGSINKHNNVYNEYKKIFYHILDVDMSPGTITLKNNKKEVAFKNKFDNGFVLVDRPYSVSWDCNLLNKRFDTNRFYLFAFEFDDYNSLQ